MFVNDVANKTKEVKMKKELLISTLAAGMLTMTGCGSSDDSGTTGGDTTTILSAQFIDSAVQGLSYDCLPSGESGLTDSEGFFEYVTGDICTFNVGEVLLGSAEPTEPILTPLDLSTDPNEVTNMLRFIQTLDMDSNATNGIVLPTNLSGTVGFGTDFNTTILSFLTVNNLDGTVVVSPEDALAHFEESTTTVLTDAKFIGKTFIYGDASQVPLFADSFYDDHTHVTSGGDGDGTPRAWSIDQTANIITLIDSDDGSSFDWNLTSSTHMTITMRDANDPTPFIFENIPYSIVMTNPEQISSSVLDDGNYIITVNRVVPNDPSQNSDGIKSYYCSEYKYKEVYQNGYTAYGTYAINTGTNTLTITTPSATGTMIDNDGFITRNETITATSSVLGDFEITIVENTKSILPASLCTAP